MKSCQLLNTERNATVNPVYVQKWDQNFAEEGEFRGDMETPLENRLKIVVVVKWKNVYLKQWWTIISTVRGFINAIPIFQIKGESGIELKELFPICFGRNCPPIVSPPPFKHVTVSSTDIDLPWLPEIFLKLILRSIAPNESIISIISSLDCSQNCHVKSMESYYKCFWWINGLSKSRDLLVWAKMIDSKEILP